MRTKQDKETAARLTRWLKSYPDLMKPGHVAKVTGYVVDTGIDWCNSNKLHHFVIRKAFLVPKLSLLDFMMSENFRYIKIMKEKYDEF